jgi:hypothetical protein
MILRFGYRTYEFQEGREIRFGSTEDALTWLKHLGYPDAELIKRLRECVTRYSGDPESARLTDHQVLERMAVLLYSRRITVIGREQRTSSAPPAASTASPAPAFPLSERSPRAATAPPPPPAADPPTFGPNGAAQAACLVAAAAAGTPFCQEYKTAATAGGGAS